MNIPSFLLEETINVVYRHLSYMLYNKVQVIKYLEQSFGTIPPDHITDDSLYFENFHNINAQLQRYPSNIWASLIEEAFNKLYSSRTEFTEAITQMFFEHFNPTKINKPIELIYKRTWPGWDVKFLNILEITNNVARDPNSYRMFYMNDPLLLRNRCPCQNCNTDWKHHHSLLLSRMEEGTINDTELSLSL